MLIAKELKMSESLVWIEGQRLFSCLFTSRSQTLLSWISSITFTSLIWASHSVTTKTPLIFASSTPCWNDWAISWSKEKSRITSPLIMLTRHWCKRLLRTIPQLLSTRMMKGPEVESSTCPFTPTTWSRSFSKATLQWRSTSMTSKLFQFVLITIESLIQSTYQQRYREVYSHQEQSSLMWWDRFSTIERKSLVGA